MMSLWDSDAQGPIKALERIGCRVVRRLGSPPLAIQSPDIASAKSRMIDRLAHRRIA
jgi:hypothetical protein